MALLQNILEHNARWVEEHHRPVSKVPHKKVVIFTCMDTRLVEFLEPALGIRRGDAQMIKNAGNTLVDAGGGVVRSLVVAIHVIGCEEILVIGHSDCGMGHVDPDHLHQSMIERGVPEAALNALRPSFGEWIGGFRDPLGNVERVVGLLRDNPLIPPSIPVHGLMFDPAAGSLDVIVDGYATMKLPAEGRAT